MLSLNGYLKNISKTNRPPPKPQSVKTVVEADTKITNPIDLSNEDELTKEEKITFPTICNMEDAKRAFFSKEYDEFVNIISGQPLKFYKATYKWSDDNDGKPEFIARNLLRGFVQGLEPYKKYFMVCFRCILIDASTKRYAYPSYWIVNTDINITTILGSLYDDYKFTSVDEVDVKTMLDEMKKSEVENLIGETYLHSVSLITKYKIFFFHNLLYFIMSNRTTCYFYIIKYVYSTIGFNIEYT